MVMECRFTGFNESEGTNLILAPGGSNEGPEGTYYSLSVSGSNDIPIKKIPGKDKRYITQRTSDIKTANKGPLLDNIVMVVYTVLERDSGTGQSQHQECKEFAYHGGPYKVLWPYDSGMELYVIKYECSIEAGYPGPTLLYHDDARSDGAKMFWAKWTFTMEEYNKGVDANTPSVATTTTPTTTTTTETNTPLDPADPVTNTRSLDYPGKENPWYDRHIVVYYGIKDKNTGTISYYETVTNAEGYQTTNPITNPSTIDPQSSKAFIDAELGNQ